MTPSAPSSPPYPTFPWRRRSPSRPRLLRFRSSRLFVLGTVCGAVFTDLFLYSMIVPVIPFALSSRAGVADDDVQRWTSILLAVYGAAMVVFDPITGYIADRFTSRRLPLLLGLLFLAGSTLLLCLGTNTPLLLTARILQGISASIVYTVGLALLVDTVGPNEIGEMIGYVVLSSTAAMLLGPLVGGVVYAKRGYYAVFYVAFGLVGLDLGLRGALIEKKVARRWEVVGEREVDNAPVSEVSQAALATVPDIATQAPQANASPPSSPKRHKPPILILLSSRRLWSALFCTLALSVLFSVWDATLPLRVNQLFGWTSLGASLVFLPFLVPALVAPFVGMYIDKRGPREPATVGFLLCVVPLALLRLVTHDGIRQIVLLCGLCSVIGLCLTVAMVPFLAEITYVVAAKEKAYPRSFSKQGAYALAFGIYNSSFSAGMLVGPLWGGFLVERVGWATLTWSLSLLSAVCVGPAFMWTGGWVRGGRVVARRIGDERMDGDGEGGARVVSMEVVSSPSEAGKDHSIV